MEDFVIENGVLKAYLGEDDDITIPEGVEVIDKEFTCKARTVRLPRSLKKICHGAFHRYADFRGDYYNCELFYLDEWLLDIEEWYDLAGYEYNEAEDLENYIVSRMEHMENDEEFNREGAIDQFYGDHYNDRAWEYYNDQADQMLYDVIEDLNALLARDKEYEYQVLDFGWIERLQAGEI